ncbi:hypothetical protein OIU85_007186 [Salix viminalis]|uniref:Uncharacterized protein n=1 Tax=Salix viminalis TaxID=40686 RepID=A0A9Q0P8A1_SALVM|nr:hypothetical protein OIU85_007186 [Salix viminalis]
MRINGAGRESSKSRSTSPPNAQVRRSYGKLPVIPKKKISRGGDLGFLYPRKSPSSHDDDYEEEVEEAKALIGEDGDKDFKLRIRKKLFQTDTNAHHDRFTMPCLQINEAENLLVGAKKTRICHGDGIGVTLVELDLGDERDSTLTSQLRLKSIHSGETGSSSSSSSRTPIMNKSYHQFTTDHMIDEYDDRCFNQLFERHRQETDDIDEAFTLVEKGVFKELLWMRINGAGRESSKSTSTSPPNAQVTRSYEKLPVIPKKKRSRGGDLGFHVSRGKDPSSHDDDYEGGGGGGERRPRVLEFLPDLSTKQSL